MLGQRRLPPHILFVLSLLLGLLAGAAAYRYASAEHWLPAALWGAAAVWLVVDAVRARGWMKHGREIPAQASSSAAPTPPPTPSAHTPGSLSVDPAATGAQVNPLLRGSSHPGPRHGSSHGAPPTDRLN